MINRTKADEAARAIKEAYLAAKKLDDEISDEIKNPTMEDDAFDALLEEEERALDALAAAIHRAARGAITEKQADDAARFGFDRIGALVARLAA